GAAVVGDAGGGDARRARRGGAAPAAAATGHGRAGAGDGVRGGRRPAARGAVLGQRLPRLVARGARRRRSTRVRAAVVVARPAHGGAARSGVARGRDARGVAVAMIERAAKIVNPLGMRARPAAAVVKLASRSSAGVEGQTDARTGA